MRLLSRTQEALLTKMEERHRDAWAHAEAAAWGLVFEAFTALEAAPGRAAPPAVTAATALSKGVVGATTAGTAGSSPVKAVPASAAVDHAAGAAVSPGDTRIPALAPLHIRTVVNAAAAGRASTPTTAALRVADAHLPLSPPALASKAATGASGTAVAAVGAQSPTKPDVPRLHGSAATIAVDAAVVAQVSGWLDECVRRVRPPKPGQVDDICLYVKLIRSQQAAPVAGEAADSSATDVALRAAVARFVELVTSRNAAVSAAGPAAAAPTAAATGASDALSVAGSRSVVAMSADDAERLGVPWWRLQQIRAVLAEKMVTLSSGLPIELVPRRHLQWVNKPQRNRIVADFAGACTGCPPTRALCT